jgi:uncharacterized membrane protein YhaH (DUF805 family)
MASEPSAGRFRFLFRQDAGSIGRQTWALGAASLVVAWLVLVLAERAVARFGASAKVGIAGLFVIATMLLAACYYFLSAKRFRDRGRPVALALVLPAMGFVDAALHFLQPRTGGTFPLWFATLADIALAGVAVWNIVELGFLTGRRRA